jgi:hypothetical protein
MRKPEVYKKAISLSINLRCGKVDREPSSVQPQTAQELCNPKPTKQWALESRKLWARNDAAVRQVID